MIRSRRTISVLTSDSLLYRLSVALRYTCGIKEKCKHRFLADAVGDEEIDMGIVDAGVCQFLLRHKGCVLDNLSERYVAKHFPYSAFTNCISVSKPSTLPMSSSLSKSTV